jgi:hypothetical protein
MAWEGVRGRGRAGNCVNRGVPHRPIFECGQWISYVWPTSMSWQYFQLYGVVYMACEAS